MKFTLAEIRGMQRGLMTLTNMQLPIKLSYKLSRLFNFCSKELVAVEEARVKLVKQYAVEVEGKPGDFLVKPENESKFREELDQFLEEEVCIDFVPIPLSEFGDIKITPLDLSGLSRIITDGT